MGKFPKQNEAQQLLGTYVSKFGGRWNERDVALPWEVCISEIDFRSDVKVDIQKSAEVIVLMKRAELCEQINSEASRIRKD